jgi:hypothetical protein
MLQIDHVYEFLYRELFKDIFTIYYPKEGLIPKNDNISLKDFIIFTNRKHQHKIILIDQEPLTENVYSYLICFDYPRGWDLNDIYQKLQRNEPIFGVGQVSYEEHLLNVNDPSRVFKNAHIFVTSEISKFNNKLLKHFNLFKLYYFFHGFAALDWYRGFYALNYNKSVVNDYTYDYITFNRLVSNDRSYRCYFVSLLAEKSLLKQGQVSFGLPTEQASWQEEILDPNTKLSPKAVAHIQTHLPKERLVIDNEHVLGSASADIPRCINDSFWHIVTETVFYYDKLHLTEKIFKPIAMKQPFMLLGAPGNLAYLKSYGFKTFEGIIDESYDLIQDNDQRIEAVAEQLAWYCSLSAEEKQRVIETIAPIVEYNFHHFYGEFKHIITRELLDNTKILFKEIGYDDSNVAYEDVYKVLTN